MGYYPRTTRPCLTIYQMSLYTGCEEGTLEAFGDDSCPESFGQTQRVIFQKLRTAGVLNSITIGTDDPALLATWQAKIALATDEKMVVSPIFGDPNMPDAEARTFGSGNQVPNGVPINLGDSTPTFAARMYAKKQSTIIKKMKKLPSTIGVYLVDHLGRIAGKVSEDGTKLYPFPVFNLFVGSKKLGGFDEADSNIMNWAFNANWSDDFYIVEDQAFNAVTDLSS